MRKSIGPRAEWTSARTVAEGARNLVSVMSQCRTRHLTRAKLCLLIVSEGVDGY